MEMRDNDADTLVISGINKIIAIIIIRVKKFET
jgi:hypothetical protein